MNKFHLRRTLSQRMWMLMLLIKLLMMASLKFSILGGASVGPTVGRSVAPYLYLTAWPVVQR